MVDRPDPSLDDLDRALEGDAKALGRIVRALERPFFALARRMMPTVADAEEATQEALLRVVTHLSSFDRRAKFSTWAFRVAVNQCLDHKSRARRLPVLESHQIAAEIADGLELEAPERTDDRALLAELKLDCSVAMLRALDVEHRAAYVLGEILELPGEEAAEALDIEPAAYRKRLSRARSTMREVLSEHCGLVDEGNACRCHRRLDQARARGWLSLQHVDGDLALLRAELATLESAARVASLYRADRDATSRRDLAHRVLELLRTTQSPRA
ncbi:MAG: RNA polymerase sigma factor [Polyangiaceae bacterium]